MSTIPTASRTSYNNNNKGTNRKWSSMIIVPMAWITCGLFVFVLLTQHDLVSPSSSPMPSPTAQTTTSTSTVDAIKSERGGGFVSISSWKRRKNEEKVQEEDYRKSPDDKYKKHNHDATTKSSKTSTETTDPLQRGKAISASITARELYTAYSQIRDEYNEKAFHPSLTNQWDVLKSTSDGIEISMLHHPSDPTCPYVRMKSVMPGSIQDTWEFLELKNWDRTMPKMDPFYEGLETLGSYTVDAPQRRNNRLKIGDSGGAATVFKDDKVQMILARKRTSRILAFGKRDFTFVSVSDLPRQEDNAWVSGTVSVVTDKFPRREGYTRAFQDSVAFYEELPNDEKTGEARTMLTIVCRIDLNDSGEDGDGGFIPMWIYSKTIGLSGVLSINNMRKELVRMKEEKRATRIMEKEKEVLKEEKVMLAKGGEREEAVIPLIPWVRTRGGGSKEVCTENEVK